MAKKVKTTKEPKVKRLKKKKAEASIELTPAEVKNGLILNPFTNNETFHPYASGVQIKHPYAHGKETKNPYAHGVPTKLPFAHKGKKGKEE